MSGLEELVGEQVTVHLNLTTHRWTIARKPKGHKLGDAKAVTLANVRFKVSEAQRQYCIARKGRWVHAWAIGQLVGFDPVDTTGMTEVTYNPFRAPTFHVTGKEQPVYEVDLIHFQDKHGYVPEGMIQ